MTVNYNRAKVRREIETIYCGSAKSLFESLQDYMKQYGEDNVFIEMRSYDYEDSKYMAIEIDVDETDKQMQERIAKEERWQQQREENE